MQTVALAARQIADEFLLVCAFEVEASDIGAAGNGVVADDDIVQAVGDFFPHGFLVV